MSAANKFTQRILSKDRVFLRRLDALCVSLGNLSQPLAENFTPPPTDPNSVLWVDERQGSLLPGNWLAANDVASLHFCTSHQLLASLHQPLQDRKSLQAHIALADLSSQRLRWLRWLAHRAAMPATEVPLFTLGWGAHSYNLGSTLSSIPSNWNRMNAKYRFRERISEETQKVCKALQFVGSFVRQDFSFTTDGVHFVLVYQADISPTQAQSLYRELVAANLNADALILEFNPNSAMLQIVMTCAQQKSDRRTVPEMIVIKSGSNTRDIFPNPLSVKVGS